MTSKYPAAFIEQALVKVFSRGHRSINAVAEDLNVNHHTLKYWMKNKVVTTANETPAREKRPRDWTAAEQLAALRETHGLSANELQAWCREHGVFAHDLTSWESAFCAAVKEPVTVSREMRALKEKIAKLERQIVRKNDALAEAAALLILQKKFRALWEEEE
jgi:DNA-binding transcriptional MerR regulator